MVPNAPAIQKDFVVAIWPNDEEREALLRAASGIKSKNSRCEYKQIQTELRHFA